MALTKEDFNRFISDIKAIVYDSRSVKKGDLFVALKGETIDGHDFIGQARKNGAVYCLVEDRPSLKGKDLIKVKNPLKTSHQITKAIRQKNRHVPLLAVTGSVGKTTVKEMCKTILEAYGKGLYPEQSFNNHTGVPLTLSKLKKTDKFAVIEMGMNHPGEIKVLTKMALPDVAVITQIAPAHIGLMGSIENIISAKLEITDGMKKNAPLIMPDNDPLLLKLAQKKGIANILTFGRSAKANCRITNEKFTKAGISFTLAIGKEKTNITMQTVGAHNAMNAACAALACKTLIPACNIRALENFIQPARRLDMRKMKHGGLLIDDAFNANPASMTAALNIAANYKPKKIGLMVGDMLELGRYGKKYHTEIAHQIKKIKPELLIAVGKHAPLIVREAGIKNAHAFKTSEDPAILPLIKKTKLDVLLAKASKGVYLVKVTEKL